MPKNKIMDRSSCSHSREVASNGSFEKINCSLNVALFVECEFCSCFHTNGFVLVHSILLDIFTECLRCKNLKILSNIINSKVNSNRFKCLLVLGTSETEKVCRLLFICKREDVSYRCGWKQT